VLAALVSDETLWSEVGWLDEEESAASGRSSCAKRQLQIFFHKYFSYFSPVRGSFIK